MTDCVVIFEHLTQVKAPFCGASFSRVDMCVDQTVNGLVACRSFALLKYVPQVSFIYIYVCVCVCVCVCMYVCISEHVKSLFKRCELSSELLYLS
jgi:hypothetical protein